MYLYHFSLTTSILNNWFHRPIYYNRVLSYFLMKPCTCNVFIVLQKKKSLNYLTVSPTLTNNPTNFLIQYSAQQSICYSPVPKKKKNRNNPYGHFNVMYTQSKKSKKTKTYTDKYTKPSTFFMTHESKMKNLLSIVLNITFSLSNTTYSSQNRIKKEEVKIKFGWPSSLNLSLSV